MHRDATRGLTAADNHRSIAWLAALLGATLGAACLPPMTVVPADPAAEPASSDDGITLAAFETSTAALGGALARRITAIDVEVSNSSGQDLDIRLDDFVLIDDAGRGWPAQTPWQVTGAMADGSTTEGGTPGAADPDVESPADWAERVAGNWGTVAAGGGPHFTPIDAPRPPRAPATRTHGHRTHDHWRSHHYDPWYGGWSGHHHHRTTYVYRGPYRYPHAPAYGRIWFLVPPPASSRLAPTHARPAPAYPRSGVDALVARQVRAVYEAALPEGALPTGRSDLGRLYFPRLPEDVETVTLIWTPRYVHAPDIPPSREIPLRVQ